jgi:hypothetical protein
MIQYNKIEPETVEIWNADGCFATVNEYEFNDIRIQIKKEKVEGFYVLFNGEAYAIDGSGNLSEHPKGLFEVFVNQLDELTLF